MSYYLRQITSYFNTRGVIRHGIEYTQTCSTVRTLDNILDFLDKNGYKSVIVSELLSRSTQLIPESFGIYPPKKGKTSHIDLMF